MHYMRITTSDDKRDFLLWLQKRSVELARKGVVFSLSVDDLECPNYVDMHIEGIESKEAVCDQIAMLLFHYLRGVWLYRFIGRTLRDHHSYLDDDEQNLLQVRAFRKMAVNYPAELAANSQEGIESEDPLLFLQIRELLLRHGEVHLGGVMTFRFAERLNLIHNVIKDAVDSFLANKEYEEFVSVLRFFADSAIQTPGEIHLVCARNVIRAYEENRQELDLTLMKEIALKHSSRDLHPHDVLMSALITRGPERIVLHADAPEIPFFMTVEKVFGDRVKKRVSAETDPFLSEFYPLEKG